MLMRFIFYESPESPIGSLEMVCGLHSSYLFVSFVLAVPVSFGLPKWSVLLQLAHCLPFQFIDGAVGYGSGRDRPAVTRFSFVSVECHFHLKNL